MGEVVRLAVMDRAARLRQIADHTPNHPALSWQVNGALLAHRRVDATSTTCGRTGQLTVSTELGVPPCPKCYPG